MAKMTKDTTADDLVAMGYKSDTNIKLSNQISELKKSIQRNQRELKKLESYAKKADETRSKGYALKEDLWNLQYNLNIITGNLQNLNLMRTQPEVYGNPKLFLEHARTTITQRFVYDRNTQRKPIPS